MHKDWQPDLVKSEYYVRSATPDIYKIVYLFSLNTNIIVIVTVVHSYSLNLKYAEKFILLIASY